MNEVPQCQLRHSCGNMRLPVTSLGHDPGAFPDNKMCHASGIAVGEFAVT